MHQHAKVTAKTPSNDALAVKVRKAKPAKYIAMHDCDQVASNGYSADKINHADT